MYSPSYQESLDKINRRWRWWYPRLIEWMIANPGTSIKYAALANGGPIDASEAYLRLITSSDLFRAHYAKRVDEIAACQTAAIIAGSNRIVELTTQCVLEHIEKKRDQVPIETLVDIRRSTLEQLGYGKPAAPLVTVNAPDQRVQIAVNTEALAEARSALRALESQRGLTSPQMYTPLPDLEAPDAVEIPEDGPHDGGSGARPGIREESRNPAERSSGIQSSGQEDWDIEVGSKT